MGFSIIRVKKLAGRLNIAKLVNYKYFETKAEILTLDDSNNTESFLLFLVVKSKFII